MQPTVARPPRRAASTILSRVHRGVASRVGAREHLGERWVHSFDVPREVVAVLEIELVLPALLGGDARDVAR
jgi:hypothetical protein